MGKGKALNICLTILLSLAVANAPAFAGKTIYVDDDATGANNGSFWADAYNYLQDALSDANSSAKPVEIRVAQGVYTPDSNSAVPDGTGDREATFRLINGMILRGGHAGFGRPDPNARDMGLYETILSGDLRANDIGPLDPWEFPDDPSRSDNSYHVVIGSDTDATAVLDGFTITAGNANGKGYSDRRGGGMYNDVGGSIIANCMFLQNSASWEGGGMYNLSGNLTVTGCRFEGNYAYWAAAGMYNKDSRVRLADCAFVENDSSTCGAMVNSDSDLSLLDCTFEGHNSTDGPGAMGNYGSSLSLTGCTFIGNLCGIDGAGGAMYNSNSALILTGCRFIENFGYESGGGISNFKSEVTVTNCMFKDNWETGRGGGGMFNEMTKIWVSNCTFKNNLGIRGGGGGICNDWLNDAVGTITNCTFSGNEGPYGGGIANFNYFVQVRNCVFVSNSARSFGGGLLSVSEGACSNCILWNNEAPEDPQVDARSVQFSDVQGGYPGEGNIDADPCFALPGRWDDNGTPEESGDDFWVDGDYHLKSQAGRWDPNTQSWIKDDVTSPCIDVGDPASPIGLEPFPNGGIINMGAYGGTAEASKSYFGEPPCETIIAGDINGDCQINFKDFFFIALHWLTANTP